MSKTSEAFATAIQRLLPKIGTGSPEETATLTEAVVNLVSAADQYSLAQAKQTIADDLHAAEEITTKQELGEILEAIMCCPAGQTPTYPALSSEDESEG